MPQEEIDNNAYNNRFTKIAPKRRKFVKRNVSPNYKVINSCELCILNESIALS